MKPILFNTEMVKALVVGKKTATRRLVKGQHPDWVLKGLERDPAITKISSSGIEYPVTVPGLHATFQQDGNPEFPVVKAPYELDDILYVRETWSTDSNGDYVYRANYGTTEDDSFPPSMFKWRPSIHMPRSAARIFLKVDLVKVQKLREMVLGDVLNEGITRADSFEDTWQRWHDLWDSTVPAKDIKRCGWEVSPWVWVITFHRIDRDEALR